MKIRTTKKAIRVAYSNIICLSYCSLRALDYLDADYYGTRCEGWAFDAISFPTIQLSLQGMHRSAMSSDIHGH